mmetsp:Transcript_18208/g.20393  ORF Transcript_18208/g.20393 Transcript_18208/m.20393 type:complete len:92 (+) Transcript_18208:169-444(+)
MCGLFGRYLASSSHKAASGLSRPSQHTEHRPAVPASLNAARRSARACTRSATTVTLPTRRGHYMGAACMQWWNGSWSGSTQGGTHKGPNKS